MEANDKDIYNDYLTNEQSTVQYWFNENDTNGFTVDIHYIVYTLSICKPSPCGDWVWIQEENANTSDTATYQRLFSYEPPRDKTNKLTCAPSEDSNQTGHPPSLSLHCPHDESLGP